MLKKIFPPVILLMFVLAGCGRYGFVNLNYPLEPAMYLPDNVKTIALVNRSLTAKEDQKTKIVESIVTGEIAGSDKMASDECLKAVFDKMNGFRGINIVIPSTTRLPGTGTAQTPELLDWSLVKKICDSTHADALLVLETFDSNSDLLVSAVTNQVTSIIATGTVKPAVPNQIKMNVIAFWRLYNPTTKTIIDQYQSVSYLTFDGVGADFRLPPPEALPSTAYAAGQEYVSRFLPSYYSVRRDMYKRGSGSTKRAFKIAFRRAEVANWEAAIQDWTKIVSTGNRKSAGRACLDIAVSYEVLGDTDEALKWAKQSYEVYNNKLGRSYANILLDRQRIE